MNTLEISLVVMGTIALVGVWAFAYRTFRACTSSMFRYRLWRLRDNIIDAWLADELPTENLAVGRLIGAVEGAICTPRQVTAMNFIALPGADEDSVHAFREALADGLREMTEEEKQVWDRFMAEYVSALQKHLTTGTILGLGIGIVIQVGHAVDRTMNTLPKLHEYLVPQGWIARMAEIPSKKGHHGRSLAGFAA